LLNSTQEVLNSPILNKHKEQPSFGPQLRRVFRHIQVNEWDGMQIFPKKCNTTPWKYMVSTLTDRNLYVLRLLLSNFGSSVCF
jgi:hypothetical protein